MSASYEGFYSIIKAYLDDNSSDILHQPQIYLDKLKESIARNPLAYNGQYYCEYFHPDNQKCIKYNIAILSKILELADNIADSRKINKETAINLLKKLRGLVVALDENATTGIRNLNIYNPGFIKYLSGYFVKYRYPNSKEGITAFSNTVVKDLINLMIEPKKRSRSSSNSNDRRISKKK
jgi:hypothetical protein